MNSPAPITITGPTVEHEPEDRFCVIGLINRPGRAVLMDKQSCDGAVMEIRQARRWAKLMNNGSEAQHGSE